MAKKLTLSDGELELFIKLITGTDRDRALRESGMTRYETTFTVVKIQNELKRRAEEREEYEKYQEEIRIAAIRERNEMKARAMRNTKNRSYRGGNKNEHTEK